tara:strand:+ start:1176 stop:1394 length:219 start_codon:yes stop_codon:yes gene_type:complete
MINPRNWKRRTSCELNTELSAYALELYWEQFSTSSTFVDSGGRDCFTEDAREKLDEIYTEIDSILVRNGVSK